MEYLTLKFFYRDTPGKTRLVITEAVLPNWQDRTNLYTTDGTFCKNNILERQWEESWAWREMESGQSLV